MSNETQSFKVINSSKIYGNLNTSYLTAYSSIIDNLSVTNVGSETLIYQAPHSSVVYNVIGYTPVNFGTSSSKVAYFLNNSPGLQANSVYNSEVLTLPLNAYIIDATINIIDSIEPVQSSYKSIMVGTQPVSDVSPLISGNIITGDSNLFLKGESYKIYNTPLNRGQYIGGVLAYPLNIGIPVSAVTVGVNFIPSPVFTSGSFSININYIIL